MFAKSMTISSNCRNLLAVQTAKCISRTIAKNNIKLSTLNVPFQNTTLYSRLLHVNTTSKNNKLRPEQNHARNILEGSKVYSKSLASQLSIKKVQTDKIESLLQRPWISMNNSDLLENFEILSQYAFQNEEDLNKDVYQGILEVLSTRFHEFSDQDLKHLLKCLELWGRNSEKILYKDFWHQLDDECLKRMLNWSIDEIFLINDYFYKLSLHKFSKFTSETLKRADIKGMSAENLVQYAFFLKAHRKVSVHFYDFEDCLGKNVNNFSVDELGIISMAFFKYEIPVKNKDLLNKFLSELQANIDNVSEITISAISKILRFRVDLTTVEEYNKLLKLLARQVSRCSLSTITHIAHLQSMTLVHNTELTSKILEKYEHEMKYARLKDIERIMFTLYSFNYDPETTPFYSTAIKEILGPHRKQEIEWYPKSLVYSILFALEVNYYSKEALERIMTPKFIKLCSENDIKNLGREYLVLDYCLEIEHPEYDGPRLRADLASYLLKKFGVLQRSERMQKYQKVDQGRKLLIDVSHTCKDILGSDLAVHLDSVLPHVPRQDIILGFDPKMREFFPPAEKISDMPLGTIKYAPKDGMEWIVLVTASHNLMSRNTLKPTGILGLHLRQLKRIGYTPILISYADWQNLKNVKEKQKFIAQLLLR